MSSFASLTTEYVESTATASTSDLASLVTSFHFSYFYCFM